LGRGGVGEAAPAWKTCRADLDDAKSGQVPDLARFEKGAQDSFRACFTIRLKRLDVLGSRAFLALSDLKLNLLSFSQRLEAGALNRGMMDENVLAAIFRADETEALAVVKPLDGACNHENTSIK
jgi:hypothetical protein